MLLFVFVAAAAVNFWTKTNGSRRYTKNYFWKHVGTNWEEILFQNFVSGQELLLRDCVCNNYNCWRSYPLSFHLFRAIKTAHFIQFVVHIAHTYSMAADEKRYLLLSGWKYVLVCLSVCEFIPNWDMHTSIFIRVYTHKEQYNLMLNIPYVHM